MYEMVMDEMERHAIPSMKLVIFQKVIMKVGIISHTGIMKSIMGLELERIVM